ncbi:MAG: XdhC family protein [Candidatus Rokubacteria bacterium]|nr:XdhC family protein [Candidatus Rokubacteria bacterium]
MSSVYRRLAELAQAGEPVATATVVAARGSTPREVGACMIVRRDGAIVGSVGGGCGEAQVFWEAARVLEEGRPRICQVDLTGEMNDLSPTNCGGVMEVFVDGWRWEPRVAVGLPDLDVVRGVERAEAAGRPVACLVAVANPPGAAAIPVGAKWLAEPDGALLGAAPGGLDPVLRQLAAAALASGGSRLAWLRPSGSSWERGDEGEGLGVFVEARAPRPELVIVGAGHIALPLAGLGKLLDFEVTVLDDRGAFASRERFPEADTVLVGPVEAVLATRPIGPSTYLVLVTRGHQHDEAALRAVIASDAAYIGMIGSRRRVQEVFRHLESAGVPPELTARVRAPIGLRIGAETPAEIAVAIAAELVQVRCGAGLPAARRCAAR